MLRAGSPTKATDLDTTLGAPRSVALRQADPDSGQWLMRSSGSSRAPQVGLLMDLLMGGSGQDGRLHLRRRPLHHRRRWRRPLPHPHRAGPRRRPAVVGARRPHPLRQRWGSLVSGTRWLGPDAAHVDLDHRGGASAEPNWRHRLPTPTPLLTIDHRHFRVVRPSTSTPPELVPPPLSWQSLWQSTGRHRAGFGSTRRTHSPPDRVERHSTTADGPVGTAYGSEGWGFESLRVRHTAAEVRATPPLSEAL